MSKQMLSIREVADRLAEFKALARTSLAPFGDIPSQEKVQKTAHSKEAVGATCLYRLLVITPWLSKYLDTQLL
jgi:hypothetical protein